VTAADSLGTKTVLQQRLYTFKTSI